jgi:hypothetical protein
LWHAVLNSFGHDRQKNPASARGHYETTIRAIVPVQARAHVTVTPFGDNEIKHLKNNVFLRRFFKLGCTSILNG